jgi:formylmethanofuran dehydrogenase subunit D
VKFIFNTGRTVTQGRHVESKGGKAYSEETSACFLNPVDLMELGVDEGEHVEVRSSWGSVVLRAVSSDDQTPGMVFVPYGPYANQIIPGETHSTGMPDFKNIRVEIEYTEKTRKSAWDLMEDLGGVRYDNR